MLLTHWFSKNTKCHTLYGVSQCIDFLYGLCQRLWSLPGTFHTSPDGSTKCQRWVLIGWNHWYFLSWGPVSQNVKIVVGEVLIKELIKITFGLEIDYFQIRKPQPRWISFFLQEEDTQFWVFSEAEQPIIFLSLLFLYQVVNWSLSISVGVVVEHLQC